MSAFDARRGPVELKALMPRQETEDTLLWLLSFSLRTAPYGKCFEG